MKRTLLSLSCLSLFACEDLGPSPTERVLAQNAPEATKAYEDPYKDGARFIEEKNKLQKDCQDAPGKLDSLPASPKNDKKDKENITQLKEFLSTACAAETADMASFLQKHGELASKALNLAHDYRGKSLEGIDFLEGKIDASKDKQEKVYTTYAEVTEVIGRIGVNHIQTAFLYSPLATRREVLPFFVKLASQMPPDFAEEMKKKNFFAALTAEGDETLKAEIRKAIYGR